MMRHEVWAYFFCNDQSRILRWLAEKLGQLTLETLEEECAFAVYRSPSDATVLIQDWTSSDQLEVTVSVETFVVGRYQDLPWPSSPTFARAAAKALGVDLLCDPGDAYPEVHPLSDVFLRVTPEGETLVQLEEAEDGTPSYIPCG